MQAVEIIRSLEQVEGQMQEYVRQNLAPSTVEAYRADCQAFIAWCREHDLCPLPADPSTVALFLTDQAARYKASYLQRRLSSISAMHRMAGLTRQDNPVRSEQVNVVMRGIRRVKGTALRQMTAAITEHVIAMVRAQPDTLIGKRNRALILFGFAGAFRHGELRNLRVEDVEFTKDGARVTLRKSKTDQEAAGRLVGVPMGKAGTCPVTALRDWLVASGITSGPIFRGFYGNSNQMRPGPICDRMGSNIIKGAATAAGLTGDFSGLSLRSGFATAAVLAGEEPINIMRQTGHKSAESLQQYIRYVDVFRHNPARNLGL